MARTKRRSTQSSAIARMSGLSPATAMQTDSLRLRQPGDLVTLSDQRAYLEPLTIGVVAKLAGLKPQSMHVKRARGTKLNRAQLGTLAEQLCDLLDRVEWLTEKLGNRKLPD